MEILNTKFLSNVASYGGALCVEEENNLNLFINNSSFLYNTGEYDGGSIYISEKDINKKYNIIKENIFSFSLSNSSFDSNMSRRNGGAIYMNHSYMNKGIIENCTFSNNISKNIGGAYYIPYNIIKKKPKENNNTYINNSAYSYGDNYGSNPAYIKVANEYNHDINSGSYIQLILKLYDEFDQFAHDTNFFFTDIFIEASLYDKNISKEEEGYEIIGNTGRFSKGICQINQLKIYSNTTGSCVLQISAKSNDIMKTSLIHENYILIDINIIPCNRDQLKMNLSNNNGFYCEAPKCNDCNYDNAICVAGYDNPNNDPRKINVYV
ncbi:hypothetical protein LY90DRAFT_511749 [Neocallimastix californiae]|uniref:Uncharacterized protein n=1 Tax=Neocallimastix californiae TaxID=1754190 RepID=A0A1Y2BLU6_9FUNG|nr:hypothetical protein LY90DRAFT_511749 [Neocallimastix californiae]|eukprot:ORY35115.1 hypothetical protein LY90DRAFT_511749 [Neocallimastix californiae]